MTTTPPPSPSAADTAASLDLILSPPMDACGQMALDETLLRAPPSPPDASFTPWLRFYLWSTPALTFGYAQKWMDIAPLAPPARYPSITRRLTGGGLVPHLTDLTFSAAFPAPHPWCPREIYRLLHTHLQFHLQVVGCPSALSPSLPPADPPLPPPRPAGPLQCFRSPVPMDLLAPVTRHKILGGAMRRIGDRVLYQGSLQLPDARALAPRLQSAIQSAFQAFLNQTTVHPRTAPPPDPALAETYRSAAWLHLR